MSNKKKNILITIGVIFGLLALIGIIIAMVFGYIILTMPNYC